MASKNFGFSDIQIPPLQVQNLKWTTVEEIQGSINELYQYSEATAITSINWYGYHKQTKAKKS